MRKGCSPYAIGTQSSRSSWPVVLLIVVGLHLWLLVGTQSPNPPAAGAAASLRSPQVRWL